MKKIFICSPYRGDTKSNLQKAYQYCRGVIEKGYLPIAPHTIFPNYLDDDNPDEREMGIQMGLELMKDCEEIWVFDDATEGMKKEILVAEELGIPIILQSQKGC